MPGPADRLDDLLVALRQFVKERNWEQFHDPKNLAMCLGSEVGELLAEYRWVPTTEAAAAALDDSARSRIGQELGDAGIAWLLLCDRLGLDPIKVVEEKLALNRDRYPVEAARGRPERP